MHPKSTTRHPDSADNQTVTFLLREAKKLHRAATSESNLKALPVLRRLIAASIFRDVSLPELRRQQDMIQRKHLLHLLAIESGYTNWAEYKRAMSSNPQKNPAHYSLALQGIGYPNLWFSSMTEAEQYTLQHGGHAVAVGKQAVVMTVT